MSPEDDYCVRQCPLYKRDDSREYIQYASVCVHVCEWARVYLWEGKLSVTFTNVYCLSVGNSAYSCATISDNLDVWCNVFFS